MVKYLVLFMGLNLAVNLNGQYIEFGDVDFDPGSTTLDIPILFTSSGDVAGIQIGFTIDNNQGVSIVSFESSSEFSGTLERYDDSTAAFLWFEPAGGTLPFASGELLGNLRLDIIPSDNGCFEISSNIDQIENVVYTSIDGILVESFFDVQTKEFCSFDPLEVEANVINNQCFGNEQGAISIMISGGILPYSIIWLDSNGNVIDTNIDIIDELQNGDYELEIEDSLGNTFNGSYQINSPPEILFDVSVIDSICIGTTQGQINIVTEQDLEYEWSNGETTNELLDVPAGNYSVTMTNEADCDTIYSVTIVNYDQPNLSYISNNTCSNEATGSIIFEDTSISYIWEDGSTSNERLDLMEGLYSATITGPNQCAYIIEDIIVDTYDIIPITITKNSISCFGNEDGSIEIDSTLLTSISWSTGQMNTYHLDDLAPDEYTFQYTDVNQCMFQDSVSIISPEPLDVFISLDSATCYLCDDGMAILEISGGSPDYDFEILDTLDNVVAPSNLLPGDYIVLINDMNDCTLDTTFQIVLQFLDISVFKAISVITPESNDLNSSLIFDGLENHPDNILTIFNRWGNEVFKASNYQSFGRELFSGDYNGQPLPEGKYYYSLEVKSFDKPLTSPLTILR